MIRAWGMGEWEGEGAIRFPVYPMRTILTFGSVMLALAFLVRTFHDARALAAGRSGAGATLERPLSLR